MKTELENEIVLEESSNPHVLKGKVEITSKTNELSGLVLKVKDKGIVVHGEHGIIVTEEEHVVKLIQQEFNPVTNALQNSFD